MPEAQNRFMVEITYSLIKADSRNDLIKFVLSLDNDLDPALGIRVNIKDYVDKVLDNGYCHVAVCGQQIVGAIMFYCNDNITKKAYITFIGVAPEHRNIGIGHSLLRIALKESNIHGMDRIGVRTRENNGVSIRLYKDNGFEILRREFDGIVDRLYLEKVLK